MRALKILLFFGGVALVGFFVWLGVSIAQWAGVL